mmetsp:Transcript_14549/g.43030  ORF Transcript_14549/g.43030 Transcript_14549/m.43030 type:complete len:135 (+) Transcript_14549:188-592(+)
MPSKPTSSPLAMGGRCMSRLSSYASGIRTPMYYSTFHTGELRTRFDGTFQLVEVTPTSAAVVRCDGPTIGHGDGGIEHSRSKVWLASTNVECDQASLHREVRLPETVATVVPHHSVVLWGQQQRNCDSLASMDA